MSKKTKHLDLRQQLASITGENVSDLSALSNKWLRLMEKGVIVEVHITRWRARSRLTYEDLGLPGIFGDQGEMSDTDKSLAGALDDLMALGRKSLLPPEYTRRFDTIDSSARKWIVENGAKTSYGILVSAASWKDKVKPRLQEYQAEYFQVLDEMLENFEGVKLDVADAYRFQSRIAYRRMNKLIPGLIEESEETFVNGAVDRVLDLIPDPDYIRASFSFLWGIHYIELPATLARQEAEALAERNEAEERYHQSQLQRNEERSAQNLAQQKAWEQQRMEMELEREVVQNAKAQKEEMVNTFLRDLVVNLRGMVNEATTEVLQSIQRNQRLHPRNATQLRNLLDQVEQMNFFDDKEVTRMMDVVRSNLQAMEGTHDPTPMRETLEAIQTITRSTLIDLGETPRGIRQGQAVEIVVTPTMSELRSARARLNLDDVAVEPEDAPLRRRMEQPTLENSEAETPVA